MAEQIALRGKLDLSAVTNVYDRIAAHQGQDVEVDLGAVSQIGALCLQVLISAHKTAQTNGTRFSVKGMVPRVTAQMAVMGVPSENLNIGAL